MHCPSRLVKLLVSLVSLDRPPRMCELIVVVPQIFSPAQMVFSGIGILLKVSIILNL
jgi:hypothetical protein